MFMLACTAIVGLVPTLRQAALTPILDSLDYSRVHPEIGKEVRANNMKSLGGIQKVTVTFNDPSAGLVAEATKALNNVGLATIPRTGALWPQSDIHLPLLDIRQGQDEAADWVKIDLSEEALIERTGQRVRAIGFSAYFRFDKGAGSSKDETMFAIRRVAQVYKEANSLQS